MTRQLHKVPTTRGFAVLRNTTFLTATLVGLTTTVHAQQNCIQGNAPVSAGCERLNAGASVAVPTGNNTELVSAVPVGGFGNSGFSISLDNAPIAGGSVPVNIQRDVDRALSRANIDVRFDGLDTTRILNVATNDLRNAYRAGEVITFRTSSNYPAFIARTEVRVFNTNQFGRPLVATLPAQSNGLTRWKMPTDGSDNLAYVVRVYDVQGRYDETQPVPLIRSERSQGAAPIAAAGEGEDRTRIRGIPVNGGVVTVSGRNATPNGTVTVMGEKIPVDEQGRFVTSRILPLGDQVVTVQAGGRNFVRDVEIPRSEWFYVGLGNLTIGQRSGIPGNDDDVYVDGRAAFYVDGRTEGGYRVTASVDTGDGPADEIFSRLNDKDPRRVIDRLREDDNPLYPTYGDDSTLVDNTPSRGRVYLRVENETTRLTWGDFDAGIIGDGLVQNRRALYGAELRYQSPSVTTNGDPRIAAQAYGAQSETLPQRDVLRGTGGSVYFLTRQDINGSSASISVQVIDPDTGRIVSTRRLVEGTDYTIDRLQGVVILSSPLSATAQDGGLISGGLGDYDVNLIASYEYTPVLGDLSRAAVGGRVEGWVADTVRVGGTIMTEETDGNDQRIGSVDLRYQLNEGTYAEIEVARSSGPGLTRSTSADGGLTIASSRSADRGVAQAIRFAARADLADLNLPVNGNIAVYYQQKEEGFATLNEDVTADQTAVGISADVNFNTRLSFGATAESNESDGVDEQTTIELRAGYKIASAWQIDAGVERTDKTVDADPANSGERTDVGLRLTYAPNEDFSLYVFGQTTISESGNLSSNDRIGIGSAARIGDNVTLSGEISGGETGEAAKLKLSYAPTANNEVYLGYTLDPSRQGAGSELARLDRGTFVLGGRYRYSENVSSFLEYNLDLPGDKRSLTRAYGVTYAPNDNLTYSATMELGKVRDSNEDFDRTAVSAGVSYMLQDDMAARLRLEYRTEEADGTERDRETWALTSGLSYKVNNDWRILADLDALYSDSAEDAFRNGEYLSASLGYAYRPVDNERFNMILGYRYLRDQPGEDQVTANGSTNGPKQRSHVISLAGNYDLNDKFTLGTKIGYRSSQVAARGTNAFSDNEAGLLIGRVDWHVVHRWDVFAEGRIEADLTNDADETGALVGLYRHIGDNAKVGLGFEWGQVSDDQTDLEYESRGIFIDIVAKF